MQSAEIIEITPEVKMHTKTLLISPETAKVWLAKNSLNRPLRQKHVEYFVRLIKEGL